MPNPGSESPVSSYWPEMPSGCAYYTDPKSPEYNRIVFDTGADTHNNESNVKNSNCNSGWCLPSASYRVCKNANNKYKILDSPKDNCSDNLFMVVGINHSNGNNGKYFNYDVDAANKALRSLYDYSYDEYKPIGSYKDTHARAMRKRVGRLGKNNARTEKCYKSCKNYKYFALQDGDECFCENDLNHAKKHGARNCGKYGAPWCNYIYEKKDAIVNNKVYSVYHHRTNEVIKVYLWTSPDSKGNYTGGITNKGHGRRRDSKVDFKPGDYLSFVNNVSILSKGSPTDNMSEKECKAWADARPDKIWRESGTWDHFAKGCSVHNKDIGVWYNKKNTGLKCGKDSTQ